MPADAPRTSRALSRIASRLGLLRPLRRGRLLASRLRDLARIRWISRMDPAQARFDLELLQPAAAARELSLYWRAGALRLLSNSPMGPLHLWPAQHLVDLPASRHLGFWLRFRVDAARGRWPDLPDREGLLSMALDGALVRGDALLARELLAQGASIGRWLGLGISSHGETGHPLEPQRVAALSNPALRGLEIPREQGMAILARAAAEDCAWVIEALPRFGMNGFLLPVFLDTALLHGSLEAAKALIACWDRLIASGGDCPEGHFGPADQMKWVSRATEEHHDRREARAAGAAPTLNPLVLGAPSLATQLRAEETAKWLLEWLLRQGEARALRLTMELAAAEAERDELIRRRDEGALPAPLPEARAARPRRL